MSISFECSQVIIILSQSPHTIWICIVWIIPAWSIIQSPLCGEIPMRSLLGVNDTFQKHYPLKVINHSTYSIFYSGMIFHFFSYKLRLEVVCRRNQIQWKLWMENREVYNGFATHKKWLFRKKSFWTNLNFIIGCMMSIGSGKHCSLELVRLIWIKQV